MKERAPNTRLLAEFISGFGPKDLPGEVEEYIRVLAYDGIGVSYASLHPSVTASAGMKSFVVAQGGPPEATLFGHPGKISAVNAVFANGTLGYAADYEPHHPEAILHPIAIAVPVALAASEMVNGSGRGFLAATALCCEITYRVSMAMNPKELYRRGFHPSAVCGTFGAAAAAANLFALNSEQTVRTLGLAALQASGLMAWQDDPREDARPFQMGMAARNGMTAALLAKSGFGAPDRIFDGGHVVLEAFSDVANPAALTSGLGTEWEGVSGLAVKPYPCVSFLHPALDALSGLIAEHDVQPGQIERIELRFARSGCHCVDDNPLKGHCAQYVLPVFAAAGRLLYTDLFIDKRKTDPEVRRLAAETRVLPDDGELEKRFPDFYVGEIALSLAGGQRLENRAEVARGYPEKPLEEREIKQKFNDVLKGLLRPAERTELSEAAWNAGSKPKVEHLAQVLARPIDMGSA